MKTRTVYLINPISGHGHLDSYARLYTRALVELGFNVVLLAPSDGGTADYLARNLKGAAGAFHFQAFDSLDNELYRRLGNPRSGTPLFARIRLILDEEGRAGITRRVSYHAGRLVSKVSPSLFRAFGLARFVQNSRISFASYPARMALAEEWTGLSRDFVFFLYLDFMAEDDLSLRVLDESVGPWAGILFHPKDQRCLDSEGPERYLLSTSARGLALLVPEAIDRLRNAVPALQTFLVPDVADLEHLGTDSALSTAIKVRAKGRKIVLQIGTLTPHKGVQSLMDLVSMAAPERFFFAFVGRVYDDAFGASARQVRAFFDFPPENVFVHDGFIDDEREYNSVVAAADLVFAVYRDFPSSSNILTKAAEFRVPLIVSNRYLMGQLVREYHTGIAVEEDANTASLHQALVAMVDREWPQEGFDRFSADRSLARLKTVLQEALSSWLGK